MSAVQGTMRIGEVHALLRKEMPDIELSKIRYYEDKGLVQPARSRKGYRLYSEKDVECLREAIRLAHEEFVPLRVVRLRLIEQGLLKDIPALPSNRQAARSATPSVVSMTAPTPPPAIALVPDAGTDEDAGAAVAVAPTTPSGEQFFTTAEFMKVCDVEATSVNQLVAMGLITPVTVAGETAFTGADLRVARCAAPLIERGADLRLLGSLRRVVEREIGILEDLTQPLRGQGSSVGAAEAHDIAAAVVVEVAALRAELFARAVRDYLGR